MISFVTDHYSYIFIVFLLVIGMYGMIFKNNLVKKLIGLVIFQNAIILLFITGAYKDGATVPVLRDVSEKIIASDYMNPLPHTLMLTAIVVGVATVGVGLALLVRVYNIYGTFEESVILERMK